MSSRRFIAITETAVVFRQKGTSDKPAPPTGPTLPFSTRAVDHVVTTVALVRQLVRVPYGTTLAPDPRAISSSSCLTIIILAGVAKSVLVRITVA